MWGVGRCTVPSECGFVVDVVPQHGLGLVEEDGGFLGAAGGVDDFLEEVGVVSSCRLDEELAWFGALGSVSMKRTARAEK